MCGRGELYISDHGGINVGHLVAVMMADVMRAASAAAPAGRSVRFERMGRAGTGAAAVAAAATWLCVWLVWLGAVVQVWGARGCFFFVAACAKELLLDASTDVLLCGLLGLSLGACHMCSERVRVSADDHLVAASLAKRESA